MVIEVFTYCVEEQRIIKLCHDNTISIDITLKEFKEIILKKNITDVNLHISASYTKNLSGYILCLFNFTSVQYTITFAFFYLWKSYCFVFLPFLNFRSSFTTVFFIF